MSIDQLFNDAVEPITEKISARKQMTRVASRTIRDFKRKNKSLERGHLNYLKDLVHYTTKLSTIHVFLADIRLQLLNFDVLHPLGIFEK